MVVSLSLEVSKIEDDIRENLLRKAFKSTEKTKSLIKKHSKRLKEIAMNLRPPDLEVIGLLDSLRAYCSGIQDHSDLKINFHANMDQMKIPDDITIVLFRIVQEAINNIIKHTQATEVTIMLIKQGRQIKLEVRDDGRGFVRKKYRKGRNIHMGIRGMKEMSQSLGGSFDIQSAPGKGTVIIVVLPLRKERE
jgi:signal transduction histidine kinase